MSATRTTMRRSSVVVTGVAALLAVALASCTPEPANDAASCGPVTGHRGDQLVVEGDPWSGYAPFRPIGDLLPGRLEYREELDQAVRACDLTTGRADVVVTTIGQYLQHRPDGTIVGVIDQSRGADALVLNTHQYPYLTSIDWVPKLVADFAADHQKPVLAYTGSSPSEELLHELANTYEDFKPDQFKLVSVDQSASALAMLESDQAQLAILWEPDTTAARDLGNVVAYSSADVPNSIVDVIVAGNRLIEQHPESVRELLDAYYASMDEKLADQDELARFIAEDGGLTTEQARSVLDGIVLYGSQDADTFLNRNVFPLDEPQVRQSLRAIGSLLALSDPSVALRDDMVDGSFVSSTADPKEG